MQPKIIQDLLKIVGSGGMMIIVLAIVLQWTKMIPSEDVMAFIVWGLGSASVGVLIGLLVNTTPKEGTKT